MKVVKKLPLTCDFPVDEEEEVDKATERMFTTEWALEIMWRLIASSGETDEVKQALHGEIVHIQHALHDPTYVMHLNQHGRCN